MREETALSIVVLKSLAVNIDIKINKIIKTN